MTDERIPDGDGHGDPPSLLEETIRDSKDSFGRASRCVLFQHCLFLSIDPYGPDACDSPPATSNFLNKFFKVSYGPSHQAV